MAETRALNELPPASEQAWRRLALRALAGRPFETLISHTFEGLEIQPLYSRAMTEGPRAFRQEPGPWKIAQRIDHPDPTTANLMARADLDGGADALVLTVAGSATARGFGTAIDTSADLDATLHGIDLDRVPLRIDAGPRGLDIARALRALAHERRLTSAALDVDFGHDPIGTFARSGRLRSAPDAIGRDAGATSRSLRGAGFSGRLFLADGRPYHEAGAGEAQELACVVATGVAYLRLLEDNGLGLSEARDEIAYLLTADADQFLTLAKFRALRQLWAHVESACGLAPRPIRLHAETAFRMMTRYDPHVNILRATLAVLAAAIGGADTITALPYTLVLGLPDEAARRLARNTGLVLIHEAHLAEVADPVAGSGAFEALTEALCTRAWALFQRFEQQGGMIASLEAGLPQSLIAETAAARHAAIACRRLAITGTSAFPDLAESPALVLEPARTAPEVPHGNAISSCPPLARQRDAEPFELLRAASDEMLARTGARPRVFLVLFGTAPSVARDAEFARDLFAVAGIEAMAGSGTGMPSEVAAAFSRSGCRIACLCVPESTPQDAIVTQIDGLRAAGAAGVTLVGRSDDDAAGLQLAESVEIVTAGCDILHILRTALALAAGLTP
jgi:methylmalonyl-CoA mutase